MGEKTTAQHEGSTAEKTVQRGLQCSGPSAELPLSKEQVKL